MYILYFFFFQAEDGIRDSSVTGVSDVCSSDLEYSTRKDAISLERFTYRPASFPIPDYGRTNSYRDDLFTVRAKGRAVELTVCLEGNAHLLAALNVPQSGRPVGR